MRTAHNRYTRLLIVGAIALAALLTVFSFRWTTTWAGPSQQTSGTGPQPVAGAPTNVVASINLAAPNGKATLTWAAPAYTGTSAITGYRVTASPGGATTPFVNVLTGLVTGLANGTC